MAGRKRLRRVHEARERAIAEGRDPDQAEREVRQQLGMSPMDAEDRRQRQEKGMPEHPALGLITPNGGAQDRADEKDDTLREMEDELSDINLSPAGKPLTDYERVKRDAAIIQLLKRGISREQAGAQFGLSVRQVARIKKKYRSEVPDISELDPGELVRDTLDNYEAAIEELALLAARTDHGPTKVGAVRVRLEALRGRIELLQSVGAVPHDLGQIRVIDDAQLVARQIAEVFERYGVPQDVQMAVVDAIEGRAPALPEGQPYVEVDEVDEVGENADVGEAEED